LCFLVTPLYSFGLPIRIGTKIKNDKCWFNLHGLHDRRSTIEKILTRSLFFWGLSLPVVEARGDSGRTKTLPESYMQGTAALGDSEETAPIPKEAYKKLPSGVIYADIKEGVGETAKEKNKANIQWVLRRSNGYFVDSSEKSDGVPFIFNIGDPKGAIIGLDEGVRGMKMGGIRRLLIPPSMAYIDGPEDGKPGPTPVGYGPKQQIRRIQKIRKDVPGEYLYFEVKLTRLR